MERLFIKTYLLLTCRDAQYRHIGRDVSVNTLCLPGCYYHDRAFIGFPVKDITIYKPINFTLKNKAYARPFSIDRPI